MNIVISGVTGGIGFAIAKKFALNGDNLILLGRSISKLKKISKSIKRDYKVGVQYYCCDVDDIETVSSAIESIVNSASSIDLLINSTGFFHIAPIIDTKNSVYDNCMDVNVRLPYLLSIGLFDCLKNEKGGKVINIGSSSS